MSDFAVEALAAAVKHASSADATEVVSVAQQFYAFLNNPGGGTTMTAPAVVPVPAPETLGAVPLDGPPPPVTPDPEPAPDAAGDVPDPAPAAPPTGPPVPVAEGVTIEAPTQ